VPSTFVALYTDIEQRRTASLKVTTISPVVPVGTSAMAMPAIFVLVAEFLCCTDIVAEIPPMVTLLIA